MSAVSSSSTALVICDEALRSRAYDRARSIALSLIDVPNDDGRGLAANAGDALVHMGALYATGEARFESAMHAALGRAARCDDVPSIGIFSGLSGLRAVAHLATAFEPRYGRLVAQCDAYIDTDASTAPVRPSVYWDYDVLAGWSGARLARCVQGALERDHLSERLEWLIEDWDRWKCAHPVDTENIPVNDLGMAHGLAGMLSSLVLSHETLSAAVAERIRDAAHRLASYCIEVDHLPVWPNAPGQKQPVYYRSSWCYGTPGVACALFSVGAATGDEVLKASATDAERRIARATLDVIHVDELGICHGSIGNALCYASLARAANCEELASAARSLTVATLDALDVNGGVSPSFNTTGTHNRTNELVGTGGIALALFTMANAMPSHWMRLHGLAPL